MFNWFKKVTKPKPRYKIEHYPDLGYIPFYLELGVWWSIKDSGVTGISEDSVLNYSDLFFKSEKEAGETVNKHATKGGRKTIWVG